MNVAVTGATGRTGRAVVELAAEREDLTVAFGVAGDPDEARVAGARVYGARELPALLDEQRPNVLVDFTAPEASVAIVGHAADAGIPAVVGTTGFDDDQRDALAAAAETVPVLVASNFSRGIQALEAAVEAAVERLPGYDVELTETHHNGKRDAPSGTANTLLDAIDGARGAADRVHGRHGDQPRAAGEIGVHARRAGGVRGEHEVLLAGNDEVLTLTHRAESREVFAAGALDAAVWLAGQRPGRYDFADALEAGA
ncbi:MAG: 4-hydroxy-tetrahydrodipicolinate reductase [Halobacteriales archaeon]|nr:4-hydroxy-tetrahydrodipicolinate reductase [Halobacteriales archaeon]